MAITFYHMFDSIGMAYFEADEMPSVAIAYEDMSLNVHEYALKDFRVHVGEDNEVTNFGIVYIGAESGVDGFPSTYIRPVYYHGKHIGDARCQYLMADVAMMLMRL